MSNRAELEAIKDNLDGKYYLTNDIDLGGKKWTPIGSHCENTFTGIFDGQGYVIRNMTITGDVKGNVGLFGHATGATIKNVGMEATNIDIITNTMNSNVGSIVGSTGFYERTYVSNCYNTGNLSLYNWDTDADNTNIGGIAGLGSYTDNCYNTGDITSTMGGSASTSGISGGGFISNSFNTGTITSHRGACGIGGVDVINSFNIGSVTGESSAGGISATGGLSNIVNSYSAGDVAINFFCCCSEKSVGGILGTYSFNKDLEGNEYIIKNVYWNSDNAQSINKQPQSPKRGIGAFWNKSDIDTTIPLTTAQMQIASSFVGFDFENVWTIIPGINNGMPILCGSESIFGYLPVYSCSFCRDSGRHCRDCCVIDLCDLCKPPHNCDTCKDLPNAGKLGHVLGQENITISDALEILKYIVNLSNTIEACDNSRKAATITGGPIGTADALEILKYIVGMEGRLS